MGKKNGKEKELFDPTIYDYLDNATIDDWISAFLSRNDNFQRDYDKLKSLEKSYFEIIDKLRVVIERKRVELSDPAYQIHSDSELEEVDIQHIKANSDYKEAEIKVYKDYGVRIIGIPPRIVTGIRLISVKSPNRVSAYRVFSKEVSEDYLNGYYNKARENIIEASMRGDNYRSNQRIKDISPTIIFQTLFPEYFYELTGEQFTATKYGIGTNDTQPIRKFPPEKNSLLLRIDLELTREEIMRQIEQELDVVNGHPNMYHFWSLKNVPVWDPPKGLVIRLAVIMPPDASPDSPSFCNYCP